MEVLHHFKIEDINTEIVSSTAQHNNLELVSNVFTFDYR